MVGKVQKQLVAGWLKISISQEKEEGPVLLIILPRSMNNSISFHQYAGFARYLGRLRNLGYYIA